MIRSPGRIELAGDEPDHGGSALRRLRFEWLEGIRVVRHSRTLSTIFAAHSFSSIAEGFFITLGFGPFVISVLEGTEAQVGWLATAQSVGGLIAGVIVVKFVHRFAVRALYVYGNGLIGVCDALTFSAGFS